MYLQDKSLNPGVVEAPADPFTLPHFIGWLKAQPAEAKYCYDDFGRCLAAQYCASIGRSYFPVLAFGDVEWAKKQDFRGQMEWVAVGSPRTFGAALSRAIALQEAR